MKKNLIFTKQFGFRNNYSTNHGLISITERIKDLVGSGNFVCDVFVNLEKAIDTVNDKILCYGLRGKVNTRIQSYLSNRKQFVSIDGYDSV